MTQYRIASVNSISVFVPGKPEPQGSVKGFPIKRANGRMGVSLTSDNPEVKGFRQRIQCALRLMSPVKDVLLFPVGAVRIHAVFIMPRPASAPKTPKGKPLGPHIVKPDLDKLQRAVGDACSGQGGGYGVITDDNQITAWVSSKRYAELGEEAGTCLEVVLL